MDMQCAFLFHSLNLTNKWNIPQGHRTDAFIPFSCYNCGSPDLTADVCPNPRDEAKIKKANEARDKVVVVVVTVVVAAAEGGVGAVIALILGTHGVPMVTPNVPIKSQLMESRRGMGNG